MGKALGDFRLARRLRIATSSVYAFPCKTMKQGTDQLVRIGVVVPLFRGERFIGDAIDSLRAQTFTSWECIVVDDGSPDGSAAIVERIAALDSRVSVVRQQNRGVSTARNSGFARLSPEVTHVIFMDQDDIYASNAFEILVNACLIHNSAIGAHGIADWIDSQGRRLEPGVYASYCRRRVGFTKDRISTFSEDMPTSFELLLFSNPVCPPGLVLAQRSVYERAGPWDPMLRYTQDWDMLLRITRFGNLVYVPETILYYRRHEENGSNDWRASDREMREVYHKTFFARENTDERTRMLGAAWRAWQEYRIGVKLREMREAIARREIREPLRLALHVIVHCIRFVRGYPSRTGW